MEIKDIVRLIDGEVIIGDEDFDVSLGFASDLMSDVLAFIEGNGVLITGLINNQVIRTAEMIDIKAIIFVRGKKLNYETIQMANRLDMTLIATDYTLYETSGILYSNGLKGLRDINE